MIKQFIKKICNFFAATDPNTDNYHLAKYKLAEAICEKYLSDPHFCEWAWGKNFNELDNYDKMKAWNELHKDLMILKPDDSIETSLRRMKAFYETYKNRPFKGGYSIDIPDSSSTNLK